MGLHGGRAFARPRGRKSCSRQGVGSHVRDVVSWA